MGTYYTLGPQMYPIFAQSKLKRLLNPECLYIKPYALILEKGLFQILSEATGKFSMGINNNNMLFRLKTQTDLLSVEQRYYNNVGVYVLGQNQEKKSTIHFEIFESGFVNSSIYCLSDRIADANRTHVPEELENNRRSTFINHTENGLSIYRICQKTNQVKLYMQGMINYSKLEPFFYGVDFNVTEPTEMNQSLVSEFFISLVDKDINSIIRDLLNLVHLKPAHFTVVRPIESDYMDPLFNSIGEAKIDGDIERKFCWARRPRFIPWTNFTYKEEELEAIQKQIPEIKEENDRTKLVILDDKDDNNCSNDEICIKDDPLKHISTIGKAKSLTVNRDNVLISLFAPKECDVIVLMHKNEKIDYSIKRILNMFSRKYRISYIDDENKLDL